MKIIIPTHKRRTKGKQKGIWRKVKQYKRPKRPSHGRILKKNVKIAKVEYYTDQYGQISPKGRKWKILERVEK